MGVPIVLAHHTTAMPRGPCQELHRELASAHFPPFTANALPPRYNTRMEKPQRRWLLPVLLAILGLALAAFYVKSQRSLKGRASGEFDGLLIAIGCFMAMGFVVGRAIQAAIAWIRQLLQRRRESP